MLNAHMPGNSSTISPSKSIWSLKTSRFLIPGPLPGGSFSFFCRSLSVRLSSCACIGRVGRSRRLPAVQYRKHHLEDSGWNLYATFAYHHHCHSRASVFQYLLSPSFLHAPFASCAFLLGFAAVLGVHVVALAPQSIRSSHS
jgi:hypothetical protein